MTLARSDFPGFLRSYGADIRGRPELLSKKILPAAEEFWIVVAALQQCLSSSRKISWDDKASLGKQLADINEAVSKTLDHDEGTLVYRDVREHWRRLQAPAADFESHSSRVGVELRMYGTKQPPSAFDYCVALLAHCNDEDIPRLCRICSIVALTSQRYCRGHNPSIQGKKGYERGQRVWLHLTRNQQLGPKNRYPIHQHWRTNFLAMLDEQQDEKKWRQEFVAEIRVHLGRDWRKRISGLSDLLLSAPALGRLVAVELVKSVDKTDFYALTHPRYFACKIAELHAFIEADNQIPKRNRFSFARLIEILNSHGGSTRLAAAELKISQRRVQVILKKNAEQ